MSQNDEKHAHCFHQREEGELSTEAGRIAERIAAEGPGRAFTAADFADITSARNAGNVLGRMRALGELARAIRGVYYVPERSELLGAEVPARHVYASSGPYKTYSYEPYEIELRHRANRDLLGCSPVT